MGNKKKGRKAKYNEKTITRAYRMPMSVEPEITAMVKKRLEKELVNK